MGDDVAVLKLQLADRMRVRFEAAANADVERKGISSWDGESLPERVETPGGAAYPALVDEGKSVGVRAFTSAAEAAESHRAGGARLLWLAHADQVESPEEKIPVRPDGEGRTAAPRHRRHLAGRRSSCSPPKARRVELSRRSPDEFRVLSEQARGRWYEAAAVIGKSLDEILEILPEIQRWIAANRKDRNLGEIAEDLDEQLAWLFRKDFAWRAGLRRPARLPAPPAGDPLAARPLVLAAHRQGSGKNGTLRRLWLPWFQRWTADPDDPRSGRTAGRSRNIASRSSRRTFRCRARFPKNGSRK